MEDTTTEVTEVKAVHAGRSPREWAVKIYTWRNGRIANVSSVAGRFTRRQALTVVATWERQLRAQGKVVR